MDPFRKRCETCLLIIDTVLEIIHVWLSFHILDISEFWVLSYFALLNRSSDIFALYRGVWPCAATLAAGTAAENAHTSTLRTAWSLPTYLSPSSLSPTALGLLEGVHSCFFKQTPKTPVSVPGVYESEGATFVLLAEQVGWQSSIGTHSLAFPGEPTSVCNSCDRLGWDARDF